MTPPAASTPPMTATSTGCTGWTATSRIRCKEFKDRFHDPGLLAKYLGFEQAPLLFIPDPEKERNPSR